MGQRAGMVSKGTPGLCLLNRQWGACPGRSPLPGVPPARSRVCHHVLVTNDTSCLTHSGGPGQWRGDARCPRPAAWFAWCHPAWPPRSGPGCSPPSRCCQRSSPRPVPPGWPAHTVSPPRSWSELQGTAPGGLRLVPLPWPTRHYRAPVWNRSSWLDWGQQRGDASSPSGA